MSKYLIDEIERTSNIVLEPRTQVMEAVGEERLEASAAEGPAGRAAGAGIVAVCVYRRGAGYRMAAAVRSCATRMGLCWPGRICARDGKLPEGWRETAGAVSARVQRAGGVCGRGCAARLGQARGFGGGRGVDCGAVCAPVSGGVLSEGSGSGDEPGRDNHCSSNRYPCGR